MKSAEGIEPNGPLLAVVVPWVDDPGLERICAAAGPLVESGHLELIISVDGTPGPRQRLILDQCLAQMNPSSPARVVESPVNAGPGAARDAGLAASVARYVNFTDADDLPDLIAMIRVAQEMQRLNLEVVAGGFEVHDGKFITRRHKPSAGESLRAQLVDVAAVWRFVFSADWLSDHECRFESTRYGEDILFLLSVADSKPKFAAWPEILYHYSDVESDSRLSRTPPTSRDVQVLRHRLWTHATGSTSREHRIVSSYWLTRIALRRKDVSVIADPMEQSLAMRLGGLARLAAHTSQAHRQRLRQRKRDASHSTEADPDAGQGEVV